MKNGPLSQYKARVESGELQHDAAQEEAASLLQTLHDELAVRPPPKQPGLLDKLYSLIAPDGREENALSGVYLHGRVGRGKSMLMDMFFQTAPVRRKRRVHFHAFMQEVHDFMHTHRNSRKDHGGVDMALPIFAKQLARDARLLCFDEFYVEDVADAMILGRLFTAMLDMGVVMVATSNTAPDDLYEGGLQRDRFESFIELLKCRMHIFNLDGQIDYRRLQVRGADAYNWPLDRQTVNRTNDLFAKLLDGKTPAPETLTFKGHDIHVPQAADGIARFGFGDLCETALGAGDYLAIAERYHTVFLDGVKRLPAHKRNEAKRFINLVDTLYENKTRLVVTAEVPPDRIYAGDDHGAAFHRTVSRLLEMQSAKWLADAEDRVNRAA